MCNSVPGSFFFCTRISLGMRLAIYSSHFLTTLEYTTVLCQSEVATFVKVHTHSLTIVFWACNTRETKKKNSTTRNVPKKILLLYVSITFYQSKQPIYVRICFDTIDLIQRTTQWTSKINIRGSDIIFLHVSLFGPGLGTARAKTLSATRSMK